MRDDEAHRDQGSEFRASDLHSMLKRAEEDVHKDAPQECSMTTTTPETERIMRKYRNISITLTLIIETTLFATGASFWWQALAIYPSFMAITAMQQEKAKM